MKNILLCGMKYDNNFGDSIINDCCKYIIEQELLNIDMEYKISEIDMTGKDGYNSYFKIKKGLKFYLIRIVGKIIDTLKKVLKKNNKSKIYAYLDLINWYFSKEYMIANKYYKDIIKQSNAIIFVGGGMIKYKYQNCYHYINFVTKLADKYNIPVCLNAVGVEGYDKENIKCRLLNKALNRKCIKIVTTRDDIDTLYKYIINKENIICEKVSDPAIFVDKVYNIEKDRSSNIIGLGVCRGDLFLDNDIPYNEQDLIMLWENIIKFLNKNNKNWKIYTNGLDADNEFAIKLVKKLELDKECLIIPNSPRELVKTISQFKGIIATRLHSSIVAYSLKVPSIGLVWNNKLKLFGKNIKYPQRFFEYKDFKADTVVKQLENAIEEEYRNITPEEYGKSEKEILQKFLNIYCR